MNQSSIVLRAGSKALERIRRNGLSPIDVAVIPGAAGGPKALGIMGLDLALFADWLPQAPRERDLVGASIGSWRFAAVCRGDIRDAFRDFGDIYCGQRYPPKPSQRMVSESAHTNTRQLLEGRESQVLAHPYYRLHVLTTRGLGAMASRTRFGTPTGFAIAGLANAISRKHLRHFAERMWFHDPRGMPSWMGEGDTQRDNAFRIDHFHTRTAPLSVENLHPALWASAAIPMVMEGVQSIQGAPYGTYWDGGIVDYHLHLPYHRANGITLYPHFTDRIIPGWLDKPLPWRRARGLWLENLLLVSPSPAYLATLPFGKLPDRSDFKRFGTNGDAREIYWRRAMAESARMGDEFLRLADSGEIAQRVIPL